MKVLVTGGVRSGKSTHAESLMAPYDEVTYVAPGPLRDDADWAARVAAHQARRPASWTTLETGDLVHALRRPGPVLVDCLGTWLTRFIDEAAMWEAGTEDISAYVEEEVDAAVRSMRDDVVVVTNEVGFGVVPEHRSGRIFRDVLGAVNQRFAAACDEVHLVVAGRVLKI